MMIKKIIVRTLFIIVVFIFFVLYLAPANKLVSMIDLPNNVRLYDVRGDLWNGHVETVDIDNIRLSKIDWKFNMFTLFFSKGVAITVSDPEILTGACDVNVLSLNKEIRIKNAKFDSYLEKVIPLLKLPIQLKVEGGIRGNLETVLFDNKGNFNSIDGVITLNDVLVQHPFDAETLIDVGRINVEIKGDKRNLKIQIKQDSDVFSFNGDISVVNMSEYDLTGGLRPKGAIPDKVGAFIGMLGKPGTDGQIKIKYKGRM